MAGPYRVGCAKETGERVMIENNRNHINVQSRSAGVHWEGCRKWSQISGQCDQLGFEDKHYDNDPHYAIRL